MATKKDKFSMLIGIEATSVEAATRLVEAILSAMTPEEKELAKKKIRKEIYRELENQLEAARAAGKNLYQATEKLLAERDELRKQVEQAAERQREMIECISHHQWCRYCAEDGCSNCDDCTAYKILAQDVKP